MVSGVANELTIPILPCRQLDDLLVFYEALGFEFTYRQARPNQYAAVRLSDIELQFCEPEEFDPEQSYSSVIVVVPDAEELYGAFAEVTHAAMRRRRRGCSTWA
jgi:hypothetical protein